MISFPSHTRVPNGTSGLFAIAIEALLAALESLPAETSVGKTVEQPAERREAVTTQELESILRDYAGTHVVVAREGDAYELRIVPPIIRLRWGTLVERAVRRQHRGAHFRFDKEELHALTRRESPSIIVGDAIHQPGFEVLSITAAELRKIVAALAVPDLAVHEVDHSCYVLLTSELVSVHEDSPLHRVLRDVHQEQGRWPPPVASPGASDPEQRDVTEQKNLIRRILERFRVGWGS